MIRLPLYVGRWVLIPELSLYQSGNPPISGTYSIERAVDGSLALRLDWRASANGDPQSVAFGGPPDGTPQHLAPADGAGAADSFTLTHIDDFTLDSAAIASGRVTSYARRVASEDGTLMAVVQELGKDGMRVRNFQVYRRATP